MPRQRRVEYEGATYHVMARGNRREVIFRDDRDREAFLSRLGKACEKTGWEIRAFVLMSNHYHLVLHTPLANLVDGMRWFQNAYTRYFNSRHREWGRLFGDRYKSVLVEEAHSFGGRGTARGDYLTALIDYVHLNPARAGIIDPNRDESLLEFPWSSLAMAYAVAPSKRPEWIEVETGFSLAQCRDTVAGRRGYVKRLDDRMRSEKAEKLGLSKAEIIDGQTLNSTLQRGWYWGSQAFRDWLLKKLDRKKGGSETNRTFRSSQQGRDNAEAGARDIIERGRKWFQISRRKALKGPRKRGDWTRVAIAWAVKKHTSVSQAWIAEELGLRSAPNVSQQVRRFEAVPDRELAESIRKWKKEW